MEKKTSKQPVVQKPHHQRTQSGGDQNEAESKRQPQPTPPQRVMLVEKPYQGKKKAAVEKIKEPKRGLGVAKLEILRLEGKLKHMTEQLEQLQAEKGVPIAAAATGPPPTLPTLLPRPPQPRPQYYHHQFPNGMIPVPYGTFVPGAMIKDGHPHPLPHHTNFVFQPLNQNAGYPGEPMNVIPNGGFPAGNGGGFIIPGGHHQYQPPNANTNINGGVGFPTGNGTGGFIPAGGHHESNTNMINRNGGLPAPAGRHHHEPNNIMNGIGGGSSAAGHLHHELNAYMNGNGLLGFSGGEVNIGGYSKHNYQFMFLDQQLRIQHLKLLHSARELCAIQRMQYNSPRRSKFDVKMDPVIIREEPKSKNKMVIEDSPGNLEFSLGSITNIHGKMKKHHDDDEEVEEVDAYGVRKRRCTSSSATMASEFFPGESSDNRSSSYSGGGGMGGGSSEASPSTSNEKKTQLLDLSLKLSL